MALIAQKLWRKFLLSKSVSGYFRTKKIKYIYIPNDHLGEGGGVKALVVGPLKKNNFFFASSLARFDILELFICVRHQIQL